MTPPSRDPIPMRFLADENFSAKLFPFLRSLGHNIRVVIKGTADADLAAQAKADSRIILTHDTDFADSDQYPSSTHAGILLIRINPLHAEQIKASLANLFSHVSEPRLVGHRFLVFEDTFAELDEGEIIRFDS